MSVTLQPIPRVTSAEGSLHVDLIAQLVNLYGANTVEFRKHLIKAIRSADTSYAPGGEDELLIPHRIPDAWLIDGDRVIVWEVESTCVLTRDRLHDWALLWAELDASDLDLTLDLRVVDKHGVERSIDLIAARYASLPTGGDE